MAKKKNKQMLIILGVIAVLVVGYLLYDSGKLPGVSKPLITNGWWNQATQECWANEHTPTGQQYDPTGYADALPCCFNIQGQQVYCEDSSKIINSKTNLVLALYGSQGGTNQAGIFPVAHANSVKNNGDFIIDNVSVISYSWTAGVNGTSQGVTILNNAWLPLLNRKFGPINPGMAILLSATSFNAQDIGGDDYYANYNNVFTVKAESYGGQLNATQSKSGTISAKKQKILFDVSLDWS